MAKNMVEQIFAKELAACFAAMEAHATAKRTVQHALMRSNVLRAQRDERIKREYMK